MDKNNINVLVVEDSPDDADLMLRELTRAGFAPAGARVETAEALTAALDAQAWDIILCDHSLPRFDSFGALKISRERAPHTPFIVVSGSVGEETAVALMKAGAADYIMKDRIARLYPAVVRELKESEVRRDRLRADEALASSERLYRTTIDALRDPLHVMNADLRILMCNKALVAWMADLRMNIGDPVGRRIFEVFPFLPGQVMDGYREIFRTGKASSAENLYVVAGRELHTQADKFPVVENGQVVRVITVIRDLTDGNRPSPAG